MQPRSKGWYVFLAFFLYERKSALNRGCFILYENNLTGIGLYLKYDLLKHYQYVICNVFVMIWSTDGITK